MALFYNVKNTSKISANSFPLSRTQLLKNRFPRWRAPAQQDIRHIQQGRRLSLPLPSGRHLLCYMYYSSTSYLRQLFANIGEKYQ